MPVTFRCRCGHEFRTQSDNAGKRITCPNCLTQATVPRPDPEAAETSKRVTKPTSPPPVPTKSSNRDNSQNTSRLESTVKPASQVSKKSSSAMSKDSATKATRPANTTKPKSRKSPGDEDNPFDLSDIGPLEAPSDELDEVDEFEEMPTPRRKKPKAKMREDDEDSSIKKGKSKKPKRDSGSNLPLIIGGVVAGVVLIGTIGFFAIPALIASAKDGGKIKLPQEFETFENNDIFFRCQYPKGWEAESRGGSGNVPPSVRIEQGHIKISYRASNSGAAIQDMAQAGANMSGELPDELKPVARVHDFQREKFSSETPDYKEFGAVEVIQTGWGEGRLSTFTSSGNFGSKMYGYRVTLLTTNYQWNVVCQCPTRREFEAYKPLFRQVVESTGASPKR